MNDETMKKVRDCLHWCGLTAETLVEDFDTLTPKEVKEHLTKIARQCEIMATDHVKPTEMLGWGMPRNLHVFKDTRSS